MDEVFGVYEGCIFEGGGVKGTLYYKKEDAIADAEKTFKEKERRSKEMFYVRDREHYDEYKWRKCDKRENRWHNTVEEIIVVEYKV